MKIILAFVQIYLLIGLSLVVPFSNFITTNNDHKKSNDIVNNSVNDVSSLKIQSKTTRFQTGIDFDAEIAQENYNNFLFNTEKNNTPHARKPDFWTTLYSIESKQGRLLYRPSNKRRNCETTSAPCGHHQLSLQALKDISCLTQQCKRDRENYKKSLAMSKKLQAINDRRLKKAGYTDLPEYQKYLIHQQGASGLKTIIASSKGKKLLSRNLKKNMAGNSPYSYRKLKRMGSKLAAKMFLKHWENKWEKEKVLIVDTTKGSKALIAKTAMRKALKEKVAKTTVKKEDLTIDVPLFNDYELQIALNIKI